MTTTHQTTARIECNQLEHAAITRLKLSEAISELYSLEVEIACVIDQALDVNALVSSSASIVFEQDGSDERSLHGIITGCQDSMRKDGDYRYYTLQIRPRSYLKRIVTVVPVLTHAVLAAGDDAVQAALVGAVLFEDDAGRA